MDAKQWDGKERRSYVVLSPDQIEELLTAAAEAGSTAALNKIYAEIGQSLVKRTLLIIGALLAAILAWVNNMVTIGIGPK